MTQTFKTPPDSKKHRPKTAGVLVGSQRWTV